MSSKKIYGLTAIRLKFVTPAVSKVNLDSLLNKLKFSIFSTKRSNVQIHTQLLKFMWLKLPGWCYTALCTA